MLRRIRSVGFLNRAVALILKLLGLRKIWARWPLKGEIAITIANFRLIFYSNCDDYLISNMYYERRNEEREELEYLISIYDRMAAITFVDLGSYNGLFSIAFGSKFSNANIYAVEPNPVNYRRLEKNIELNKIGNIKSVNIGISDRKDCVDFYLQADEKITTVSSFTRKFTERHTIGEIETVKVETVTLDNLYKELNLKPDLIKIDVEGHELSVLNGGKEMIRKCKPTILCEIFTRKFQSENEYQQSANVAWQIDQLLKSLGYDLYIYLEKELVKVSTLNYENPNRNYLLIHQEKDLQFFND
jgi:FkbM family methyltransferase